MKPLNIHRRNLNIDKVGAEGPIKKQKSKAITGTITMSTVMFVFFLKKKAKAKRLGSHQRSNWSQ